MAKSGTTDGQILKGLLDTLVLDALRDRPNYGFGIRESLGEKLGEDAELVREATLYPLLHRLERRGYLASHKEPGSRGTPRKYYRLTADGKRFLDERIREWHRIAGLVRRVFEVDPTEQGE